MRTPTAKKAARSLSLDLAIADEAYAHTTMGLAGAIRNTLLTRPLAQFFLTSNAGDETSALWRHYTDLGRASVLDPTATMGGSPQPEEEVKQKQRPTGARGFGLSR